MTSPDILKQLKASPTPLAKLLGIELLSATPDRIEAELLVRQELCTVPDILHGGALMAFADNLGAVGAVLNLGEGKGTTTIESKTNFLAAIPRGQKAHGVCTPVHKGRKTSIWETRITREDGRLAALIIQTQLVL